MYVENTNAKKKQKGIQFSKDHLSLFKIKIHEKGTCKTKEDGDDSRVLHAGQEKKGTSKFSNDVAKKRKLPHALLIFSHFVLSIHL